MAVVQSELHIALRKSSAVALPSVSPGNIVDASEHAALTEAAAPVASHISVSVPSYPLPDAHLETGFSTSVSTEPSAYRIIDVILLPQRVWNADACSKQAE
jgi:hypothetical protein